MIGCVRTAGEHVLPDDECDDTQGCCRNDRSNNLYQNALRAPPGGKEAPSGGLT